MTKEFTFPYTTVNKHQHRQPSWAVHIPALAVVVFVSPFEADRLKDAFSGASLHCIGPRVLSASQPAAPRARVSPLMTDVLANAFMGTLWWTPAEERALAAALSLFPLPRTVEAQKARDDGRIDGDGFLLDDNLDGHTRMFEETPLPSLKALYLDRHFNDLKQGTSMYRLMYLKTYPV